MKVFIISIIFIIFIMLYLFTSIYAANKTIKQTQEQYTNIYDDEDTIQTKWSCLAMTDDASDVSKSKYVIGRKDINTNPQCVAKPNDKNACNLYDDVDTCRYAIANSDILSPYHCTQEDINSKTSPCGIINTKTFQCYKVSDKDGKSEFMGLRLNKNDDIECLGNDSKTCVTYDNLLYCHEGLDKVKNDKYLTCGDMLKQLYGIDGYGQPGHYCSKFKQSLMEPPKILPSDIDVVSGYSGNYENIPDKNMKPEDCRQRALNSNGKYVAWGHRNRHHPDESLRNTCFLYTRGFAPYLGNPDDKIHKTGCIKPDTYVNKGCTKYSNNTQDMVGKWITLSHPDGRVWKNNENSIKLNVGTPMRFKIYYGAEVYGNPNKFAILQDDNKDLAVRHTGWILFAHRFTPNNYDFGWNFVPSGSGVRIFNDYENTWVGYNEVSDSLIICKEEDKRIVAWNVLVEDG